MTDMMRHSHSVIEVAERIHGAIIGSTEPIPVDEARGLVRWLYWRVNYAWEPSHRKGTPSFYDEAVRLLGLSAIDLAYHPKMGVLPASERPD